MPAELKDPRKRGPAPPFSDQPQSPPGSEGPLAPHPDHGEDHRPASRRLIGRSALVTGGDSGIGRAVALRFAQEGADVAIIALPQDNDDARETLRLVTEVGQRALVILGDVQSKDFCFAAVQETVGGFGALDILVNNAAMQRSYDDFSEIPEDEIDACFRTNVYGLIFLTQAAKPHLRPGASVINTTSINAYTPSPSLPIYAATKAAIANLTKSLSALLIENGVRVNAVAPGPVWTPLIPSTMPREKVRHFGENTAFKRPAQPVEQAALFAFLASDEASYVTGEVFGATGGRTPY